MGKTFKMWTVTDKGVEALPKTVILEEIVEEKRPSQDVALDNSIIHGMEDDCPASECDVAECECKILPEESMKHITDEGIISLQNHLKRKTKEPNDSLECDKCKRIMEILNEQS